MLEATQETNIGDAHRHGKAWMSCVPGRASSKLHWQLNACYLHILQAGLMLAQAGLLPPDAHAGMLLCVCKAQRSQHTCKVAGVLSLGLVLDAVLADDRVGGLPYRGLTGPEGIQRHLLAAGVMHCPHTVYAACL